VFSQVTILGPGLLGASLARSIRERHLAKSIIVWAHRAETRLACEEADWCDRVEALASRAVAGSEFVVLATPVHIILELLDEIGPSLDPGTLVTDVGSTKSLICRAGRAGIQNPSLFIGSHPMAGSEKTGWENSTPRLFEEKTCFITPLEDAPEKHIDQLARFWKALGMQLKTLNPETHDEIVAHISHLPHLLAAVLSSYLASRPDDWAHYAGQGLKDTTRIAAGSPTLWKEIIEQNREEILRALHGFQDNLHRLEQLLNNKDYFGLTKLLEQGKDYRRKLPPGQ